MSIVDRTVQRLKTRKHRIAKIWPIAMWFSRERRLKWPYKRWIFNFEPYLYMLLLLLYIRVVRLELVVWSHVRYSRNLRPNNSHWTAAGGDQISQRWVRKQAATLPAPYPYPSKGKFSCKRQRRRRAEEGGRRKAPLSLCSRHRKDGEGSGLPCRPSLGLESHAWTEREGKVFGDIQEHHLKSGTRTNNLLWNFVYHYTGDHL